MLRQSLKTLVDDAEGLVRAASLDPTARPEQLSVMEFASLARAYRSLVEAGRAPCKTESKS